ncbi:sulfatase-like hydrolase/transferase [Paraburkholderia sp. BR10923]|uniref:sulfatase-like hydrolase/transferase n=1 Tax=Paraburkholderia sp. BR10923 TaxID=3236992 RepID=UPI0034CDD9D3
MDRREFIKKTSAIGAALTTPKLALGASGAATGDAAHKGTPNILFILLDEMRYPRVFPAGINSPGDFLRHFMPQTHSLWRRGVKFSGHYTAASACTPARGTLVTGLYSQQTWVLTTIFDNPSSKGSLQPTLSRVFPTYGKLLRNLGYSTPYIGKWHLSVTVQGQRELQEYGFQAMTFPDPTGSNLQGTVGDIPNLYYSDEYIANQAVAWLNQRKPNEAPWCLTVGLVNPHDKEFFPAGTEFQTYHDYFANSNYNPNGYQQWRDYTVGPPNYDWNTNPLKNPPTLAYAAVPPNWESADRIQRTKPAAQAFNRMIQEAIWGGVQDDPDSADFVITEYPVPIQGVTKGIGKSPFSYWKRSLESYTQILTDVDERIGEIVHSLPHDVARNTIIILTSDHGEYAGAHGMVSGKTSTCYEEAYNIPLIVVDPTGRYAGDVDKIRDGLTSSVDILPMLVTIGNGGNRNWLTGDYAQLYGGRHDLLPMLKSDSAAGRPYVTFTTDETLPESYIPNASSTPTHIIGVRTQVNKLGTYSFWAPESTTISGRSQLEYYDYATTAGQLELDNRYRDPAARVLYQQLLTDILPNELRAPLPGSLVAAQTLAEARYVSYVRLINSGGVSEPQLPLSIGDI